MVNAEQVNAAVSVTLAIGDTIRELGSVPSGHLYARLMDKLDLGQYEAIIGILKRAGAVSERGHLLTWIGGMQ